MPDSTPSIDLQFEAGDPIPGIAASPLVVMPISCGADGSALLNMLIPSKSLEHAIYFIRDGRSFAISMKSVPGISDVRVVHNLFATDSEVGALIYARKQELGKTSPADYKHFVVMFDRNGTYKALVELPFSDPVVRFAMLPSGDLIVTRFDEAASVPRLLLLDSSGGVKGPIQMPEAIRDAIDAALSGDPWDVGTRTEQNMAQASTAMGSAQFAAYGEKVLLWLPGKNTVLEIGDEGARREVNIQSLKGYELAGMLPSNTRWIAQFKRRGLSDSGPIDSRPEAGNFLLYEVNPSDGSLRRRFNESASQSGWVACEHDGKLLSFGKDEKQRLIPYTADLGK